MFERVLKTPLETILEIDGSNIKKTINGAAVIFAVNCYEQIDNYEQIRTNLEKCSTVFIVDFKNRLPRDYMFKLSKTDCSKVIQMTLARRQFLTLYTFRGFD